MDWLTDRPHTNDRQYKNKNAHTHTHGDTNRHRHMVCRDGDLFGCTQALAAARVPEAQRACWDSSTVYTESEMSPYPLRSASNTFSFLPLFIPYKTCLFLLTDTQRSTSSLWPGLFAITRMLRKHFRFRCRVDLKHKWCITSHLMILIHPFPLHPGTRGSLLQSARISGSAAKKEMLIRVARSAETITWHWHTDAAGVRTHDFISLPLNRF